MDWSSRMPEFVHYPAITTLYQEHHGWLKGWLRKRIDCSEQAADLAQDTFVRLLQQRKIDAVREPRAYLSNIARGLMIDKFRRKRLEDAYLAALACVPEPLDISPEERMVLIEALVQIDQMLDGLGPRTREVFLLAQLDGLSYVEIGRRLEVSLTTVKKHAARAMVHCLLLMDD
jgi:RNA polymerase sigma-70 factor (ECF subfamily)